MSLWSSLASFGSSFIPVIGPALSAGIGALTGSKGGGGGNSGPVDPLSNPTVQAMLKGIQSPATMDPATKSASDFFHTALAGDEQSTRSLLGPDVTTILDQYDHAAKAAAELGPRGGGRTAIEAEAPFQKAGAYGKLLGQAKNKAAEGLVTIGGQQTAAASARRGQDVSVLGQTLGSKSSYNDILQKQAEDRAKQFSALGSGIGSTLVNILTKSKGGGGGGGSTLSNEPYSGSESGD